MLALIVTMIVCVALGAAVVGYVMVEARREGRGDFWTSEGEELIAGARRTGEKVRQRGTQLGRSAASLGHNAAQKTQGRRDSEAASTKHQERADRDDPDLRAAS